MEEQSDVAGRRKRLMSQTEQSNSSSLIPQIGRDLSINCLSRCSRSDYGSIAKVNRSFWSLIRSGELHRASRNGGIVEHWVYFPCSSFEWMCFDPVGIRWMHLPRVPRDNFWPDFERPLAVGTELLLFGREVTGLRAIYKFSILTNSWSLGSEMNEPRFSFGYASLGEIVIVTGGRDRENNILSSAEIYNSETGTWVSLPRMNRPREMCSGVFMDGNFYIVGGLGTGEGNARVLTCGEMYDFKTRRWHEIPNMFPTRHSVYVAPPVAVVKNELYAAFYKENEVRKYDKGRILWSTVGNLLEGAVRIGSWALALSAYGDQLILIVGEPRGIEVYDCVPDEGPLQWSELTFNDELSLARFVYNCTVMSC